MHTPVASELTAISVLSRKRLAKKERKGGEKETYSQCRYEQFRVKTSAPCPVVVGASVRQDCVKGMGD